MRPKVYRWLVGIGLAGVLGLPALLMTGGPARGQQPPQEEARLAPETRPANRAAAGQELDQLVNQAKDELELLELQLDAKRALLRIGEARLEEAKRWKARYEELLRAGRVTEERFLAAKDDVLLMEAHVAGERAELKEAEMRVKQANRRMAYGEFAISPLDRHLADLEHRMTMTETKLDLLQHEMGRVRREKPMEAK